LVEHRTHRVRCPQCRTKTSKKRMRAKLSEVKAELMQRRHVPVPE
jgi:hypothetical protein